MKIFRSHRWRGQVSVHDVGFAYFVLINWIGFRSQGGRRRHADLREDPHGQDHHPRGEQKLYEFMKLSLARPAPKSWKGTTRRGS